MADKLTEENIKETPEDTTAIEEVKPDVTPTKSEGLTDEEAEQMAEIAATNPSSLSAADQENFIGWKKRKTIAMLNKEPKVNLYIPFQVGEDKNNKANHYASFGINGVMIQVRKGQYVPVPKSIFDLHMQSQADTDAATSNNENAISNLPLKYDPVTGQKKSLEHLS